MRHVGKIAVDDANTDFAPAVHPVQLARCRCTQKVDRWTVREFLRVDNLADRKTSAR